MAPSFDVTPVAASSKDARIAGALCVALLIVAPVRAIYIALKLVVPENRGR